MDKKRKAIKYISIISALVITISITAVTIVLHTKNKKDNNTEMQITYSQWIQIYAEKYGLNEYEQQEPYFSQIPFDSAIFNYVQTMVEYNLLDSTKQIDFEKPICKEDAIIQLVKLYGDSYISRRIGKNDLCESDYLNFAAEHLIIDISNADKGMTLFEAETLLNNVWQNYLTRDFENFSDIKLSDSVIVLSSVTDCQISDDIISLKTDDPIEVGDVVFINSTSDQDYSIPYKVTSVEKNNDIYNLEVAEPEIEDIFDSFHTEISQEIDLDSFIPAEGFSVDDSFKQTGGDSFYWNKTGKYKKISVDFEKGVPKISNTYKNMTIDMENSELYNYLANKNGLIPKYDSGCTIKGYIEIEDVIFNGYIDYSCDWEYGPQWEYELNLGATVTTALSMEGKFEGDLIKAGSVFAEVGPFGLIIDVYLNIDIEGKIAVEPKVSSIISIKKEKGSKTTATGASTTEYNAEINCEFEASVALDVTLDLACIEVLDAYLKLGVKGEATYDIAKPNQISFDLYAPILSAGIGLNEETLMSKMGLKFNWKIVDKEGALFKCTHLPYIQKLPYGDNTTTPPITQEPTQEPIDTPVQPAYTVANGCTYYVASTGVTLKAGEPIPTPQFGDKYETSDYIYEYGNTYAEPAIDPRYFSRPEGWNPRVKDCTKTNYEEILSSIAGKNTASLAMTFYMCENMTTIPTIPDTVTDLSYTFSWCTSITAGPDIPSDVTKMAYTFSDCRNLITAPVIPYGVTDMDSTFAMCQNLTTVPVISSSVTNMSNTFSYCYNLSVAPEIPYSVTDMSETFLYCTSLKRSPEIPSGVTDMCGTFLGCFNLTTASTIPASVSNMSQTFGFCENLTGQITINACPLNYEGCFVSVNFENQNLSLTGSSTMLDILMSTSSY